MISAVNTLNRWPGLQSLLEPTNENSYFQPIKTEITHSSNTESLKHFNDQQLSIIHTASHMFNSEEGRLHMIFGPPGTGKSRTIAGIVLHLLDQLFVGNKLLICAPSNNACNELTRRILDEFSHQKIPYTDGILVRVGGQPPEDENLCEHFHEFMIHKTVFQMLTNEPQPGQSQEPDCLNVLRFCCSKIILIGDHNQLPPTVLSRNRTCCKDHPLSLSLYNRLYNIFEEGPAQIITMLKAQYRMHPDICDLANTLFYH
ncbi:unnamed protein product, partial [Rotaria sp. Silwood1]